MNTFWSILSSAVVAAIVSSIASYIINILTHKRKYKDDYYKMVIAKRMDAYQYIEKQIIVLKFVVVDDKDGGKYHQLFDGNEAQVIEYQTNLGLAIANSIWLSDNMVNALNKLQSHFLIIGYKISDNIDNNTTIGKEWYQTLVAERKEIEELLKKDLLSLHDVKSFLKKKSSYKKIIVNIPTSDE